ncbi:MAG: hypothetical protein QM504_07250 [Pseudomonadota bacterium]
MGYLIFGLIGFGGASEKNALVGRIYGGFCCGLMLAMIKDQKRINYRAHRGNGREKIKSTRSLKILGKLKPTQNS